MNAKSDSFDEPMLMAFTGPWAGRGREDAPDPWPSSEQERTTARAFAIPDFEEEDERPGDDDPDRLRRIPRSSSPELPTAALFARLGERVGEHSYDELQIETGAEAGGEAFHGGPSESFGDSIDIEIRCGEADADLGDGVEAADEDEDENELADPGELLDETDEDANWWLRIDASALGELPIPVEDVDLPIPPGVIAGVAGAGVSLDRRLLEALESPTEVQCSCGHDCDLREHALIALFHELSANESRTLHYRLTLARQEDAAARAFVKLPRDHRARLLDLLDHHARHQVVAGPNWRVIRKHQ